MIVTLDGPAGAGKSSTARRLAERLGFRFLDTGAMYRAVAWAAWQKQVPTSATQDWAKLAETLEIDISGSTILVNGEDVSTAIRTTEVTAITRFAADNPEVRAHLVRQQQLIAASGNWVTEGRDQGTVVFPAAACKIFLTASPEVRAQRRYHELAARGEQVTFQKILDSQNQRDLEDRSREVGPLMAAADAVEFVTDGLTPEEVVAQLEALVRSKM